MVRLDHMIDAERKFHEELKCPTFDTEPWVREISRRTIL